MELTGKAKESFRKWYYENVEGMPYEVDDEPCFVDAPFSMQYGVLVDFFDSVGIYLNSVAFERMRYFKAIGIIDRAVLVPFPFLKSPSMSEIALENKYWFNTILRLVLAFIAFFCWLLI